MPAEKLGRDHALVVIGVVAVLGVIVAFVWYRVVQERNAILEMLKRMKRKPKVKKVAPVVHVEPAPKKKKHHENMYNNSGRRGRRGINGQFGGQGEDLLSGGKSGTTNWEEFATHDHHGHSRVKLAPPENPTRGGRGVR